MVEYDQRRVGVGIAGTGFIGRAHIDALRRINVNLIGLAEGTPEKAREKAVAFGIPNAYPSFEAMLDDPQIEVVHLATPNFLHFSQARAALLAGKHVVCEKPLAMTSQELAGLVALAKDKGLVNAISFNIRFYPLSQQARQMVRSGDLGDLFILQGSYMQDWLLLPTDWNWRLESGWGGKSRAVADIGSHWLDLLTFISGMRIKEVFADFKIVHTWRKKPAKPLETYSGRLLTPGDYIDQPVKTEDYASILLHFENGARGVLTVSQVSSGRKNRLFYEINGSKSSISWDSERPNEMWIGHRSEANQHLLKDPILLAQPARDLAEYPGGHNEGFLDTFKQLFRKVYEYIRAGDFSQAPEFPTFADGHYEMLLVEAIERSAEEQSWAAVGQ